MPWDGRRRQAREQAGKIYDSNDSSRECDDEVA